VLYVAIHKRGSSETYSAHNGLAPRPVRSVPVPVITAALLVISCGIGAHAQTRTLTLDEAVSLATQHNSAIKIAGEKVKEMDARKREAKASYFPVLSNDTSAAHIAEQQHLEIPNGSLGVYPQIGPLPGSAVSLAQGKANFLLSTTTVSQPITQWFWFGRRWGSQSMRLLCRLTPDPRGCAEHAHLTFSRYGLRVLFLAKFLPGLDGLLLPLAGAEGVPFPSFLALDAAGSLLWSASYVGLGYVFSNQLDLAVGWVKHFGTALAVVIAVLCALYAGWRGLTLIRMIRRLEVRRISPPMLHSKLKSGDKVAVLDLLDFEDDAFEEETGAAASAAVPGAFRVDPSRLRESPRIVVPDDVEIVLYSSSGGEIVSARAALELKRIGVENVWVLEGGLQGWREEGLPLSQFPEALEAVAERLGVRLPDA
jgi:membrane protein DedA with SNARE-associated domain/rhodanese-related sulfurtransferase